MREVDGIIEKFEALNPYDRNAVPGSILNLTDDNWVDPKTKKQRAHLLGFSISAKRYVIHERDGENIRIINPKAHGLGYLYLPIDSPQGWDEEHDAPKWIYDFWDCLLRTALNLPRKDPTWFARPQMMRMTVTTQNVLRRLHGWEGFRPYNFFLLPILADCGYPANVDPKHFTLVAPFESDQEKWTDSVCINISDANDEKTYGVITDFGSSDYGKGAVVKTFRDLLHRYLEHPEAKSLAPDGSASGPKTKGLLGRVHVTAGALRRIGKETDRRWEEGDDLESLLYEPIVYEQKNEKATAKDAVEADESLIRQIKKIGIRELMRFGGGRRILEKIRGREPIKNSTLHEYQRMVQKYKLKKK